MLAPDKCICRLFIIYHTINFVCPDSIFKDFIPSVFIAVIVKFDSYAPVIKQFTGFDDIKERYLFTSVGYHARHKCWKKDILCSDIDEVLSKVHALLMESPEPVHDTDYQDFLNSGLIDKIVGKSESYKYRYHQRQYWAVHAVHKDYNQTEGVYVSLKRKNKNIALKNLVDAGTITIVDSGFNSYQNGYLFVIDWRMALASLITFPLGMVFFMLMMAGYNKNYARTVAATNTLNDTAVEYIGGIEVIKAFGKAKSSYEKFVTAARECARSYIDWMNRSNLYFTFAMNIMPATLLSVLPIGGWLLKNGTLTPEKFVLIVILSMGLITPIIGCMKFTDDLAKVGTIISQVTDILTAPELSRPETDTESPQGSTVELRDVHFGYNDAEVLHGIDLTFPEGTVNALVGPSGSGKSTIAKLIASFWDVGSGSITVGGADIRSISSEHYNKLVAYVSQDNFLFDNTVRENIRMGRPDATDAEVEQAARDCGCYDFIMGLENGFDTVVGSGGGHLSGGEKQRISIARAMLKNAPIVILDEATAYTDPENEAIIQQGVARLVQGKTLIVIAHRLSTIVDADQIIVVNDGHIEATGTQTELLQTCPLYQTLWNAHIASRDSTEGGADRA